MKYFPRRFQEWSPESYKGDSLSVYPFDKISATEIIIILIISMIIIVNFSQSSHLAGIC